jgi:ClpP class serine protease
MSATPLAGILNEADRSRKELIKKIQGITETKIISYISNPNVSPNFIDQNDPTFLNDILESIGQTDRLDLMIDSPGGELNTTEKIVAMCRSFCKQFRVLIINRAKSAATLFIIRLYQKHE